MLEQSEQTPLLDASIQQTSYDHVQLHYPTTTIQDVVESVRGFAKSDIGNYDVSDLVTLGGDSAFYATTKVLAESKPDKREMLETSSIKMLETLLQNEYEKDIRMQRILLHEWEDGSSALDFILQTPALSLLVYPPVQASIQTIWKCGTSNSNVTDMSIGFKYRITRSTSLYIDKWRSPKSVICIQRNMYQFMVQAFAGLVYIALYLATVGNQNYTSFPPDTYEYVFYVFALSDILIESLKVLKRPWKSAVSPQTYLGLVSSYMILISFIWRIVGLSTRSLPDAYNSLRISYVCLAFISPIMLVRLVLYARAYPSVLRSQILLSHCLVDASWILGIGSVVVLGFWIAIAAINTDKNAWEVLQLLTLGALFAPQIGDTLLYEPQAIGVLMFIYLFLTTILLSSLLTASFLSTFLNLRRSIDSLVKLQFARYTVEALKAGQRSGFASFIPFILVEIALVYPFKIFLYILDVIAKRRTSGQRRDQQVSKLHTVSRFVDKWRELLWLITYSPFITAVASVELVMKCKTAISSYLRRLLQDNRVQ